MQVDNVVNGAGFMLRKFQVYSGGVKLFFGVNVLLDTIDLIKESSVDRFLIVTGRRSARVSGALDDIIRVLEELGIEYSVFSGVKPNPTVDDVGDIVKAYRETSSNGFIAIGGGSVIDATKIARSIIVCGGDPRTYLYGERKCMVDKPLLYAVNLTHGTGTEIDRWAVATIPETKEKLGMEAGYPNISIDDPRYTTTLPRNQTIYVTLDAFAHSVESATSYRTSPYTILLDSEAIKYIVSYLRKALDKPSDIEARYWLLYASMLAGISIDHSGTHLGHALEHILSGLKPELPHGAGLGILYRELMKYFYKIDPETMSRILKPLDPSLKPVIEDAEKARKTYNRFLEEIGFREKLSDYGFSRDDIKDIVRMATENKVFKNWIAGSPVKVSREDIISIIENVL